MPNWTSHLDSLWGVNSSEKKINAEKQLALMKYFLKCGNQENLTTYFFDYSVLCINKTQRRNARKAAFTLSSQKSDFEISKN